MARRRRRNGFSVDALIKGIEDAGYKWWTNDAATQIYVSTGSRVLGAIEKRGSTWTIVYRGSGGRRAYSVRTLRQLLDWFREEASS